MTNALALFVPNHADLDDCIEEFSRQDDEQQKQIRSLINRRADLLYTLAELVKRVAHNKQEALETIQTLQKLSGELNQLMDQWQPG